MFEEKLGQKFEFILPKPVLRLLGNFEIISRIFQYIDERLLVIALLPGDLYS